MKAFRSTAAATNFPSAKRPLINKTSQLLQANKGASDRSLRQPGQQPSSLGVT